MVSEKKIKGLKDKLKALKLIALDVDGVLTDGTIFITSEGIEIKGFNTKDGLGIKLGRENGLKFALISQRKSRAVDLRARELKIDYLFQGVKDKKETLMKIQKELQITKNECAFIGDDVSDLPIREIVSVFCCPKDAVDSVKKESDIVLTKKGGKGAVRELIDIVLSLKG